LDYSDIKPLCLGATKVMSEMQSVSEHIRKSQISDVSSPLRFRGEMKLVRRTRASRVGIERAYFVGCGSYFGVPSLITDQNNIITNRLATMNEKTLSALYGPILGPILISQLPAKMHAAAIRL